MRINPKLRVRGLKKVVEDPKKLIDFRRRLAAAAAERESAAVRSARQDRGSRTPRVPETQKAQIKQILESAPFLKPADVKKILTKRGLGHISLSSISKVIRQKREDVGKTRVRLPDPVAIKKLTPLKTIKQVLRLNPFFTDQKISEALETLRVWADAAWIAEIRQELIEEASLLANRM